ncbi:HAD-IA family hydrolase [Halodesulfovibrio marinisediminis]|uniref:2-haloalkanoic acid dehalogenase, type II n=1 Tax=Halodesulfovibrio marinisediminis DSM 17456 TaxID=1121457 RepID=A0A1N6IIM4_9BACT|nr:HAD-IA family hydrolase [Halodesulfovibrio marinisediminis]SIO31858.1 2-haloalkanoic acid dehalogenase, type II [Halodesulfovibrio marinisediminis DSM 17456]
MHTLVFDVYGTLVDTADVTALLEIKLGECAAFFASQWRNKQLEYSYRMGLMRRYEPFSQCMRYAFEYTCEEFRVCFTSEEKEALFLRHVALPAFEDAKIALPKFAFTDAECFVFSNGTADDVDAALSYAGLRSYVQDIVSVDSIKMYKPSRIAYRYLVEYITQFHSNSGTCLDENSSVLEKKRIVDLNVQDRQCLHYVESGLEDAEPEMQDDAFLTITPELHKIWLISSNPFDVIGAKVAGLQAAWIRRSASSVFDPWGIEPTITVENLNELYDVLRYRNAINPL